MDIEALGIPKAKVNQFNKKNIFTVEDLARYFPRKYLDFRKITPIANVQDGETLAVVGTVEEIKSSDKMVRAKIRDNSKKHLYVIWFNQPFVKRILKFGETYIFCGKVQINAEYNSRQMANPMYFSTEIEEYQKIIPVYPKIQGMSDEFLLKSVNSALALVEKDDFLEPILLNKFGLMTTGVALRGIHQPKDEENLEFAKKRFVFDDLFQFNMQLMDRQSGICTQAKYKMPLCISKEWLDQLPFELTEGQRQALKTIYIKMRKGERVNALVQGDVGCGKTIVAVILMLISCINGYQSALMAPTNVLAKQHYEELLEKTKGMGIEVAYLSGDLKTKERKEILGRIERGEIGIVVGTHAVIQKDVKFKNLALTVVDEEHRFGVIQRDQLKKKAQEGVHNVTMSATPIPRTLALTIYGDNIDVLTIKSLPKGRKPVKTILFEHEEKCYISIHNQIKEGRQCYVVCPLIEDSDSDTLANVDSVEKTYEKMKKFYAKYPEVKISMISGKMKQEEIDTEIARFARNEVQIIISTTIIEVGVNVPNATVILIKNAERFGLSQLHQLRGRVGRGNHQSYCVLLSNKKDNPKLQAMVETTDGFKIAEKDLELRGTGDFIGTKQSGQNKFVMLMLANADMNSQVKAEIKGIYQDNKRLQRYAFLNQVDISDK